MTVDMVTFYESLLETPPIGPVAWKTVTRHHNERFHDHDFDTTSLKRFYNCDIVKAKLMPTGTSEIPRELVLVRQVEKNTYKVSGARHFGTDIASDEDEDDSEDDASEKTTTARGAYI